MSQRARRGKSDQHALGKCCTRAAKAGAVAQCVDAGHIGQSVRVAARHQLAPDRVEIMPATQRPQQFVRRLEAIAETKRVDLDSAPPRRCPRPAEVSR